MYSAGPSPNSPRSCTALISRLGQQRSWDKAVGALREMKGAALQLNIIAYGAAVFAASRAFVWSWALDIVAGAHANAILTNIATFGAVLAGFKLGAQWKQSCGLLRELRDRELVPDLPILGGVIYTLNQVKQWRFILAMLLQEVHTGIRMDIVAFNTGIAGVEKANAWEQSSVLHEAMAAKGMEPDRISCNSVLTALAKGQQWRGCVQLVTKPQDVLHGPDVVTGGALTIALEYGHEWQHVLASLRWMRSRGIEADVITRSVSIRAASKASQWEACVGLLGRLCEDALEPEPLVLDLVVDVLMQTHHWQAACMTWEDAQDRGLASRLDPFRNAPLAAGDGQLWRIAVDTLQACAAGLVADVVALNVAMGASKTGRRWDACLLALHNAGATCARPNSITFSTAVSAAGERAQWEIAIACSSSMQGIGIRPNLVTYKTIASACERGHRWARTLMLLASSRQSQIHPDLVSWNIILGGVEKARQWLIAVNLLASTIRSSRTTPDLVSHVGTVLARSESRCWEGTLEVLRGFPVFGLELNVVLCSSAISASEAGQTWEWVADFFEGLRHRFLLPTLVTYSAAMSSAGKGLRWSWAAQLLAEMPARAVLVNMIAASAVMRVFGASQQWDQAAYLFRETVNAHGALDVVACNVAVTVAEKGLRWHDAHELVLEMAVRQLVPDVVTFNAAISASERASRWEQALCLLAQLPERGLQEQEISHASVVQALQAVGQWQRALGWPTEMLLRRLQPDVLTCSLLLQECEQRRLLGQEVHLLLGLAEAGVGEEARSAGLRAASEGAAALRVAQAVSCRTWTDISLAFTGELQPWPVGLHRFAEAPLNARSSQQKFPYVKELMLLRYVLRTARKGDPGSVCGAIERFGEMVLGHSSFWLKVAGRTKATVLAAGAAGALGSGGGVLEIGAYCGGSAVRLGVALPGVPVVSLEVDPIHVVIARNVLAWAGLRHIGVWTGHSKDLIGRLGAARASCARPFACAFMDQRGSRYGEDLQELVRHGLLAAGATVVADNVLKPGAPYFLWTVRASAVAEQIVRVQEFAMPAQDWMSISLWKLPRESPVGGELRPPALLALHAKAEWIRQRAMSPGRSVTFDEWAKFADGMRAGLARLGILPSADLF